MQYKAVTNSTLDPTLLKQILENSSEGIVLSDAENNIVYVNPGFTEITGFSGEEILGKKGAYLRAGLNSEQFYENLWSTVKTKGIWKGETWVRRKSGATFLEWLVLSAIKDSSGKITHYLAIFSDITERKTSAERLQYLNNYDPLTKLPNRNKLTTQLEYYLLQAAHEKKHLSIIYIDIDRFKNINSSFGLAIGDLLLQEIASRLNSHLRANDFVARFSADEFVVISTEANGISDVADLAQNILEFIQIPFVINDQKINCSCSIGISIFPNDGSNVSILLENAQTAMYRAKQSGQNSYQFFKKEMYDLALKKMQLEINLHKALVNDEFTLYYHPLVNLKTNEIYSAEALLRWKVDKKDNISPSQFVPIAEESGLIIPITDWVLKTIGEKFGKWRKAQIPIVPIAVNFSAMYFRRTDFVERIHEFLQNNQVNPPDFKIEVTESAAMQDRDRTVKILQELQQLGVGLSLDDFGVEYSSLAYLKNFPVNQIKIDQSFIHNLPKDVKNKAIVAAIIALGKGLNITVVAEGVETKEQLTLLREMGCDVIQGYLFSEPLSEEEWIEMLKSRPFFAE